MLFSHPNSSQRERSRVRQPPTRLLIARPARVRTCWLGSVSSTRNFLRKISPPQRARIGVTGRPSAKSAIGEASLADLTRETTRQTYPCPCRRANFSAEKFALRARGTSNSWAGCRDALERSGAGDTRLEDPTELQSCPSASEKDRQTHPCPCRRTNFSTENSPREEGARIDAFAASWTRRVAQRSGSAPILRARSG